ncbi:hypothetical protein QVD17_30136 [Tagetes erecta]|uniref:RRM domain-containing protein n=1 Tax=Tagetes erecta TaxID=13708 RepID=A0AAD8NMR7_TARER|nr:hypothetical protein QVD17_30136 [Tagetes erecta]
MSSQAGSARLGPRILKWLPVNNKNKNKTSNATVSDHNKLQRWKNSCKNYHQNLAFENNTTSLMIKNIPNKYTRKMLMQTLDVHCDVENKKIMNGSGNKSAYDFLYLPIDFRRRMNGGFAFVNFTNTEGAARFRDAFNGKRWNVFESSKVAQISRAKIQGKEGLINNCKDMDFSHGLKEDMPVIFAPPREGFGHQLPSKMFTVGKYLPRRKYSRTTHA